MASSLSTTASASVEAKRSANLPLSYNTHGLTSRGLGPERNSSTFSKAQLNEVSADLSSNVAPSCPPKSQVSPPDSKDLKPPSEPCLSSFATEGSISRFIAQVSSIVKIVDSRDIAELKLKQLDYKLIIRKKEALLQPLSAAPVGMMSSPAPQHVTPCPNLAASSSVPAAKSAKSSLQCPMAGTFYRNPAPGEPPSVKADQSGTP